MTVGVSKYYVIEVVDGKATIHKAEKHSTTAVQFFKDLQRDLDTYNAVYFQDGETHRQCTTRDIEKITCEVITGYETKAAKSLWRKWFRWLFNFFSPNPLPSLREKIMESAVSGWSGIDVHVKTLLKTENDPKNRSAILTAFNDKRDRDRTNNNKEINVRLHFVQDIRDHFTRTPESVYTYSIIVMSLLKLSFDNHFDLGGITEDLFASVTPGSDREMAETKRSLQRVFYGSSKIIPFNLSDLSRSFSGLFLGTKISSEDETQFISKASKAIESVVGADRAAKFADFLISIPSEFPKLVTAVGWDKYNDILLGLAITVLTADYPERADIARNLVEKIEPRENIRIEVLKDKVQKQIDSYAG